MWWKFQTVCTAPFDHIGREYSCPFSSLPAVLILANQLFIGCANVTYCFIFFFSLQGMSGTNLEYFKNLMVATKAQFPAHCDDHLDSIEAEIHKIAEENTS